MPQTPKWHVNTFWLKSVGDNQLQLAMEAWLNGLPKTDAIVTMPLGVTGVLVVVREAV